MYKPSTIFLDSLLRSEKLGQEIGTSSRLLLLSAQLPSRREVSSHILPVQCEILLLPTLASLGYNML